MKREEERKEQIYRVIKRGERVISMWGWAGITWNSLCESPSHSRAQTSHVRNG
jgi:hypothetical protein